MVPQHEDENAQLRELIKAMEKLEEGTEKLKGSMEQQKEQLKDLQNRDSPDGFYEKMDVLREELREGKEARERLEKELAKEKEEREASERGLWVQIDGIRRELKRTKTDVEGIRRIIGKVGHVPVPNDNLDRVSYDPESS
ncbi:hypothetical protein EST38_g10567 [Candolleomyces aberdarensis]|uniref:Uncharacterized protein n=1 Tax=Candolleomyces aberdarensis TaxID=2316362 RepID=A0A4Q2D8N4_9AGAR|nr:hypothetical protein EST38_g10567 [Candolleomyces aberdarensis]